MEARRTRSLTRKKPFSDNTTPSFLSPNPIKPNTSSFSFNKPPTKCTSFIDISTNLDSASNPSSPPPTTLSTPSLKTTSLHGVLILKLQSLFQYSIVEDILQIKGRVKGRRWSFL